MVQRWTGNPKTAGSNPVEKNFFRLLVLSSRRSGGFSLGFRAGIAFWPKIAQTIKRQKKYFENKSSKTRLGITKNTVVMQLI